MVPSWWAMPSTRSLVGMETVASATTGIFHDRRWWVNGVCQMPPVTARPADGDAMSYDTPACPVCSSALTHSDDGAFNPWVCPKGHGLAATLSEGYERIDEDELKLLWHRARAADATVGPNHCPMCERPMVVVAAPVGTGPELPLDICTTDELLWFDNHEIDEVPPDADAVPLTPDQQAHLDQITQ